MKIGQVSNIVGISPSAIRYYERLGLLRAGPVRRAENGYRDYSTQDVETLRLIGKLKTLGLELEEIKHLVCDEAKVCSDLVASVAVQIEKYRHIADSINQRISRLEAARLTCNASYTPSNAVKKCCNQF